MIRNKALILGVSINSSHSVDLLDEIVKSASNHACVKPVIVFTPNPEFLVEAHKDHEFCDLLNKADINLPDGIGLVWASRVLGKPLTERVSGADVVEKLLESGNESGKCEVSREVRMRSEDDRWVIGIVGARRGVQSEAEELIKRLQKRYLNINFVNLDNLEENNNTKCEWEVRSESGNESEKWVQTKNTHPHFPSSTHIPHLTPTFFNLVFACQGMKKQENWIWENKDKVKSNVFMGIGGSLDFLTGFTQRAPVLLRSLGFEWVWRLLQKPSHIRRIWKAVFVFGWLVIKEKFKISN